MTTPLQTGFEVHSEARGGHWVAWLSRSGETGPHQSVLVVGETQEEAESKAREWAGRSAAAQAGRAASS